MKLKTIAVLAGVFIIGLAASVQACEQARDAKPTHTTLAKGTGALASEPDIPAGSALTVFIDGPTGFVFVWTADGWKFVRKIEEGDR